MFRLILILSAAMLFVAALSSCSNSGTPGTETSPAETTKSAPAPEAAPPAKASAPTKTYVVSTGAQIPVRVDETIDSAVATEGQTYGAGVTQDILDAAGDVVVPRGASARVIIRSASKGGRIKGASDLVLDLDSVTINGKRHRLDTEDYVEKGRDGVGKNKRTALFGGTGAAAGAIIGAIAGGGKGAAIGAASGAGAGIGAQILTKGGSIKVPAESVLTFKLDKPLRVVASR